MCTKICTDRVGNKSCLFYTVVLFWVVNEVCLCGIEAFIYQDV